jgi:predicted signal transduction protein with EAL and GGDEF domain
MSTEWSLLVMSVDGLGTEDGHSALRTAHHEQPLVVIWRPRLEVLQPLVVTIGALIRPSPAMVPWLRSPCLVVDI